jgi:thioredoxin-dependent peroxiredoxin
MKISTALIMCMFALTCVIRSAAAADLKVGDPAPDFELKGSDGQLHHLGDYKGKQAVVLAWFPMAFTPGCTIECKSMKEDGDAIKKFDAVYFTASVDPVDGPKGNKAFAESLGADYPILSDPEQSTAKAYGVLGGGGKANRWTFYIGKDGNIAAIEKDVNSKLAGGHYGNHVADKLKDLGVPEKK